MENTFDLKKFLVENKLTKNSKILSEVEQSVEIANNLKKIKVDAEAVISMAKKGIEDQEKYAGLNRDVNIDVQAVEQQIEVVEDALERIEDYAGDGWAVDIEDVAREKNIAELQNMLETLIEETDKLHSVYAGKPLQEGDLNEGWKQWALGAISALSVLGGGAAINQQNREAELDRTQKIEYFKNTLQTTLDQMSPSQLEGLGIDLSNHTGHFSLSGDETPEQLEYMFANYAKDYIQANPTDFKVNPQDGLIHWKYEKASPYYKGQTLSDKGTSWNERI
jgi:hypothetical protein